MFPHETLTSRRRIRGAQFGRYCLSFPVMLLLFALAVWISLSRHYVLGALIFAGIISLELFLSSDLTAIALPVLLTTVFVTNCYDSFDTFIRFAPLAPIPIAAICYNIIVFREKIKIGRTFSGLVAVSLALLLGGVGFIAPADYFSPTSLFYVLGLGVGMTLFYLLVRSRFRVQNVYGIFGHISVILYLVGILAVINIVRFFWVPILDGTLFSAESWPFYRPSNNLSTILMFAMPFPVWFALKQNPLHIFSLIGFYAAICLTGSRAGLLLGGIEFLICLWFWARYSGRAAKTFAQLTVSVLVFLAVVVADRYLSLHPGFQFIGAAEMRRQAIPVAVRAFLDHPLFGIGIKNHALDAFHVAKKGALAWFHMYIPQIIASMGTVGIIAYAYQLLLRFSLFIRRRNSPLRMTLGISYIGVFLMSQLNPGEFCPIPYGMMVMAIFALLEQLNDTERLSRLLAPEWSNGAD